MTRNRRAPEGGLARHASDIRVEAGPVVCSALLAKYAALDSDLLEEATHSSLIEWIKTMPKAHLATAKAMLVIALEVGELRTGQRSSS